MTAWPDIAAMLRQLPAGAIGVGRHPVSRRPCYVDAAGRPVAPATPNKLRAAAILASMPRPSRREPPGARATPNKLLAERALAAIGRQIRRNPVISIVPSVPVFSVIGYITDATAANALKFFSHEHPNAAVVNVIINSHGGNYEAGKKIYRAMRAHRGQVNARVVGDCMSAAVFAALGADWAEATPDARFLLHGVEISRAGNPQTRWTADEHKKTAAEIAAMDADFSRFLAGRTGLPVAQFTAAMKVDKILSAQEALDLRIINAVLGDGALAPARR